MVKKAAATRKKRAPMSEAHKKRIVAVLRAWGIEMSLPRPRPRETFLTEMKVPDGDRELVNSLIDCGVHGFA